MKPRGWAVTDVGRKREHNEDSFLCSDDLQLYAVADGMGGHLGGERASHMAAEILEREMAAHLAKGPRAEMSSDAMAHALREATVMASKAIFDSAQAEPNYAGMGTTLTGLCFHGSSATVCHVGDSRAYLFRDGRARQLTEDHSWVQEQVRAGLVAADDILVSRFRNIITRSVGFESGASPDISTMLVEAGDCFLLCSDGLCNYLSTEELGVVLSQHFYGEAGSALVAMANERGGDDNITCVIVYVANGLAGPTLGSNA
ncbi:MAG: PP2C family serine/threonine-protein phosphatase [Polyangia bacterium]